MRKLAAEELSWSCPEQWIPWQSSEEIEPASTIVGQERAVTAISFGLAMGGIGYNIFVTGLSGTGRLTTIKRYLEPLAGAEPTPDDVCFVYNFRSPEQPCHLCLRAGAGSKLRDGMEEMIKDLAENLPGLFNSKEFHQQIDRAVADLKQQERSLIESFEAEVSEAGFTMVQIQAGPVTRPEVLPMVDDKPVTIDELPALVDAGTLTNELARDLEQRYEQLATRLHEVFQEVSELRHELHQRVSEVRRTTVGPVFGSWIERLRKEVNDARVDWYLQALVQDLEEKVDLFAPDDEEGGEPDRFLRWQINLAVDNAETRGKPVVLETEPSFANLFGTIERTWAGSGEAVTNFTRIRAGSLLRANGGFLVLNAEDLLQEAKVWPVLKRALKYRRVRIQTMESMVLGASAIKPEEVPLEVKVLVIGSRSIYDTLYRYDAEFAKIFKVLADFDSVIPATSENIADVLSVLRKVAMEEKLPPLDRTGMAAIMEEAVRLGRWRRRLSSRFSDLADLVREAAYQTGLQGAEVVTRKHVHLAMEAYDRRHGLSEDRSHEYVNEGIIRIETDGMAVGQVNGLAVYDLGHHRFGRPSRITASIGIGREGVINVERQAGLSGPTHDKGVQILTGFLRGAFAQKVPLSMGCSITFEQSYGGIDGDSASSTEIYAILSAITELPLRQDIAVTGSVDQHGRIQAIGGVNEKIEGFFRVCADRGLTGNQGVMIPSSNAGDLHLKPAVRQAVADSRFHIWALDTIEQGIELLTGVPAGQQTEDQGWTPDSVYDKAQQRLKEMAKLLRAAARAGKDENNSSNSSSNGKPATDDSPPDNGDGNDKDGGDENGGDENGGDENGGDENGGDENGGDENGGDEEQ